RMDATSVGCGGAVGSRRTGRAPAREAAFEPFRRTRADGGKALGDAFERRQAETNLEGGGQQQHNAQYRKGDDERPVEAAGLRVDLGRVAGDGNEVAALLSEIDRAFNDAQ